MPISQDSTDFIMENYLQNDRQWFKDNRDKYKTLVEDPMLELAEKLLPALLKIDPLITSDPKRCISRIWKDMRLNRSGIYFRDHMWLVFRRGKGMVYPSFFFEYSSEGFRYGIGYYCAPKGVMDTLRDWVLSDNRLYLDADEALKAATHCELRGDMYKRIKFPDAPPEKQSWLQRKSMYVSREIRGSKLLFSENLHKTLNKDFINLAPVYMLFLQAHLTSEVDTDGKIL